MFAFVISTVDAGVYSGNNFLNTKYSPILLTTFTFLLYERLQLLYEIMLFLAKFFSSEFLLTQKHCLFFSEQ